MRYGLSVTTNPAARKGYLAAMRRLGLASTGNRLKRPATSAGQNNAKRLRTNRAHLKRRANSAGQNNAKRLRPTISGASWSTARSNGRPNYSRNTSGVSWSSARSTSMPNYSSNATSSRPSANRARARPSAKRTRPSSLSTYTRVTKPRARTTWADLFSLKRFRRSPPNNAYSSTRRPFR